MKVSDFNTVQVADERFTLIPVKFSEIQKGDRIAHIADMKDFFHEEFFQMWFGQVEHKAENTNEWWGFERQSASTKSGDIWEDFKTTGVHDAVDWRLAAEWHDDKAQGHALFRMIQV